MTVSGLGNLSLFNPLAPFASACTATKEICGLFDQYARALTLPLNLHLAIDHANAMERRGDPVIETLPSDFGANPANVNITCDIVSPTCNLWRFDRIDPNANRRTLLLVHPYSGSKATVLNHLLAGLLPHRSIAIAQWGEPHNLPKTISFDLEDNTDDIAKCCLNLGARYPRGFDAFGVSQSGVSLSVALGMMAQDPNQYSQSMPSNVILAGAPIDTSRDRSPINWMALCDLSSNIIIPVGKTYSGHCRPIIPDEVMDALYKCTPDSLGRGYARQALAAEHVMQMHARIFKHNLLGNRAYLHRGKRIDLGKIRGGLMTIGAAGDNIVSWAQTAAAHTLFSSAARHVSMPPVQGGHYDLVKPGAALDRMVAAIVSFTAETSPHP